MSDGRPWASFGTGVSIVLLASAVTWAISLYVYAHHPGPPSRDAVKDNADLLSAFPIIVSIPLGAVCGTIARMLGKHRLALGFLVGVALSFLILPGQCLIDWTVHQNVDQDWNPDLLNP